MHGLQVPKLCLLSQVGASARWVRAVREERSGDGGSLLPSYGWEDRGASCPLCSVRLGGVPAEHRRRSWKGGWAASWARASCVPWPHRMPAASQGCMNTVTVQETEGRVVPHTRHS